MPGTGSGDPSRIVRTVRCPQCGGDSVWSAANAFRPFCSERCKLVDLGAWASESYRVPVEDDTPPEDRDPAS